MSHALFARLGSQVARAPVRFSAPSQVASEDSISEAFGFAKAEGTTRVRPAMAGNVPL